MADEEAPSISLLIKQLAVLERKYTDLEIKCNALEASNKAAAIISSPVAGKNEGQVHGIQENQFKVDEKENKPPPSRVKVIISKRNLDGEPVEKEGELQAAKENDEGKHAFTLKRIVFDKSSQRENSSEINVTNQKLWTLLKRHLRWYPYHIFSESPVALSSPYEPIVFAWDELQQSAIEPVTNDDDKQAKDDLKLLLDTISGGSSGDEKLDKYFKIRSTYKTQQNETVQFEDLWTIFAPGTLLYGKSFQNEDQVFVVKDNRGPWPYMDENTRKYETWALDVWSYDWKDGSFGRSTFTLRLEQFDGHRPITSLPYYPFTMHPERDRVQKELIQRGKIFQKYCNTKEGLRMFDYKGGAVPEKKGFSGMKNEDSDNEPSFASQSSTSFDLNFLYHLGLRRSMATDSQQVRSMNVNSRVMVDYASYFQYGPAQGRNGSLFPSQTGLGCGCSDCQNNEGLVERYRTRFDKAARDKVWEDEQYLICPPRVLGYILQEKQWAQLQVTLLRKIPQDDESDAWNSRLKLATNDTKDMLFDLVSSHISSDDHDGDGRQLEVNDIVPGKGKGLVILLYGPPGVGKTSTAETIAVAARKPLFSISVADVGTKAKHVESNLSKIFSLATSWKAILLIDEADVFLESRGRGGVVQSIDRNALVSVFLRVLEYYQGIMFLTTNQIAQFDIAIPSRIHVAIRYESLKRDQTEAIYTGFLDKLEKEGLIEDYDEIKDWLREDDYSEGFDGRQIRNIVTTALDLARAEAKYGKGKGKLGKRHMRKAFNNVKQFKRDFETQMQRYKDSQDKMIK